MASTIASANTMKNKLEDKVKGISPLEVFKNREDFVLLDVRRDEEVEEWIIPDAVHIENIYLKDRLDELDKNKKTVVICKRGIRAYNMARLLTAKGFTDIAILDGGTVFAEPLWRQFNLL